MSLETIVFQTLLESPVSASGADNPRVSETRFNKAEWRDCRGIQLLHQLRSSAIRGRKERAKDMSSRIIELGSGTL